MSLTKCHERLSQSDIKESYLVTCHYKDIRGQVDNLVTIKMSFDVDKLLAEGAPGGLVNVVGATTNCVVLDNFVNIILLVEFCIELSYLNS